VCSLKTRNMTTHRPGKWPDARNSRSTTLAQPFDYITTDQRSADGKGNSDWPPVALGVNLFVCSIPRGYAKQKRTGGRLAWGPGWHPRICASHYIIFLAHYERGAILFPSSSVWTFLDDDNRVHQEVTTRCNVLPSRNMPD
jgi:hypothetical protein